MKGKIFDFVRWSDLNGFGGGFAGYQYDKGYYTRGDYVSLILQGLFFSPYFVIHRKIKNIHQ